MREFVGGAALGAAVTGAILQQSDFILMGIIFAIVFVGLSIPIRKYENGKNHDHS